MQSHETHGLTKDQHELIFAAIKKINRTKNIYYYDKVIERDSLICKTLWKTLQRIGATLHLKEEDVDFVNHKIRFVPEHSKTGVFHSVLIDDELEEMYRRYIENNKEEIVKHGGYLFFNYRGRLMSHISTIGFYFNFRKYAQLAGLEQIRWVGKDGRKMMMIHPHTNRGGAASHLMQQGVSPVLVKHLYGCSMRCMMKHYDKTQRDQAQKECLKFL